MLATSQGKRLGKAASGERACESSKVDADQLEEVVEILAAVEVGQLLGVEIDVDDAEHPPLVIDHRKGEKLVEQEEFAGLEHRGGGGNRDHPCRP